MGPSLPVASSLALHPVINTAEEPGTFEEYGDVNLKDFGTTPFFGLYYKGSKLKRNQMCPGDTNCFEFATKYLKFMWSTVNCKDNNDGCSNQNEFPAHVCTADDITDQKYKTQNLYLCGNKEKLSIYRNYEMASSMSPRFYVMPNYDNI